MKASLWLRPQPSLKTDLLHRFRNYPHFVETLTQFTDLHLPKRVPVTWHRFSRFPGALIVDTEEEAQAGNAWISEARHMIASGADVPPLIVSQGMPFDGRHRAIAARQAGIRVAPVVDVTPYWRP
jgi:hypothetical protein